MKKNNLKICGFTLAEVLITLGMIGIVAEMTIPTLMNNVQDQAYKIAYKKAYSVMTQALASANSDYSIQPRTVWCNAPESLSNWTAFKSKFNIIKECNDTSFNDCWAVGENAHAAAYPPGVPGPEPQTGTQISFFVDNSGMQWAYHPCYFYLVDTNGLKKPNKYGKDRFRFTFAHDLSNPQSNGLQDRIWVPGDYSTDPNWCVSGNCYYTSWILN